MFVPFLFSERDNKLRSRLVIKFFMKHSRAKSEFLICHIGEERNIEFSPPDLCRVAKAWRGSIKCIAVILFLAALIHSVTNIPLPLFWSLWLRLGKKIARRVSVANNYYLLPMCDQ